MCLFVWKRSYAPLKFVKVASLLFSLCFLYQSGIILRVGFQKNALINFQSGYFVSSLQVNASMLSSVLEAWKRVSRGSYVDIYRDGSTVDISIRANKHGSDTNMQSD